MARKKTEAEPKALVPRNFKVWIDRKFQGIQTGEPGENCRALHNRLKNELGDDHTFVILNAGTKYDIKDPEAAKAEYAERRKTSRAAEKEAAEA